MLPGMTFTVEWGNWESWRDDCVFKAFVCWLLCLLLLGLCSDFLLFWWLFGGFGRISCLEMLLFMYA